MTFDEIIQKIKDRLIDGTGRAAEGDKCLYRSPDGRGCAVGCLISDEHYNRDFEGLPFMQPQVVHAVEKSVGFSLSYEQMRILDAWQSRHDKPGHWNGNQYIGPLTDVRLTIC